MKRQQKAIYRAVVALSLTAIILLPRTAAAGNWNIKSVPELIAAINAANQASGTNTILLASGKTFTLSAVNNTTDGPNGLPVIAANNNLSIRGNGATITRSTAPSTPAFRLFDVAAGATLTLQDVTIANGLVLGDLGQGAYGGAILNATGASLIVKCSALVSNQVVGGDGAGGPGGNGVGGAIYSDGTAGFDSVIFRGNQATGGAGGKPKRPGVVGIGSAGALSSQAHGVLTVRNCWFIGNRGVGGQRHQRSDAMLVGPGAAGAIDTLGTASIVGTVFTENQAIGGAADDGVDGGYAMGGALGIGGPGTENAVCYLEDCQFNNNAAIGAPADPHSKGGSAVGGVISHGYTRNDSTMTISRCVFSDNRAIGGMGGFGGDGEGGVINHESSVPGSMGKTTLTILDSNFTGNQAHGSGVGAPAWGGVLSGRNWILGDGSELTLAISNCTFACNEAVASPGGDTVSTHSFAVGGALNLHGNSAIHNSTFLNNRAVGAASSPPAPKEILAASFGGALTIDLGTLDLQDCRFEDNQVIGGDASLGGPAGSAVGGGVVVFNRMTANIVNSLFLNNTAAGGAGTAGVPGGVGIGAGFAVGNCPYLNPLPVTGSAAILTGTTVSRNQAIGGSNGGTGMGGGYAVGFGVLFGSKDTSTVTLGAGSVVTNNVPDDIFQF